MKRVLGPALVCALFFGCHPPSTYTPTVVAPGELTLAYDHGMRIHAGGQPLTRGPRYDGLEEFVECEPRARTHARRARRAGLARVGLAWAGGATGAVALGGTTGLVYIERDPQTGWSLLGSGVLLGTIAAIFSGVSRQQGNRAHGNAIDAMNYYNDALGSRGQRCAGRSDASSGFDAVPGFGTVAD